MIDAGDKVTVNGEDSSIWKVQMAGDGSPMVQIFKDGDMGTARMIDRANLTLVAKAVKVDEVASPSVIPTRSIMG